MSLDIQTSRRLDGIGEYYFSRKLREIDDLNKQGKQIINLGIGSPDLPPHADVIRVLQEESAKPHVHAYQSYKGSPILRSAMAEWYRRWYGVELNPDTEILPLIGSKEGIMHICMTYLNEGDAALVPDPGYPTYQSAVKLAGGTCIGYKLKEANGWYPDFEEMEKLALGDKKIKLMWVNYPHMPTGKLPDRALFGRLVEFGKKYGILICHDNPYSFILNDNPTSLLATPGAREVVIELNSLSKAQNMAGWRVGMLAGDRQRIDEVLRFKSNMDSGMFLPVQLAAAKAMTLGKDWYESLNAIYQARRVRVFELLEMLGCVIDRSQAGLFVWAKAPAQYKDGYELSDRVLYDAGVFITPGGIFGKAGEGYIRVSLCCSEERLREAGGRISLQLRATSC
jgi:aspartate/methionine/tyrosine aminotransferase